MSHILAIHSRPGSFSDRWIERCQQLGISFKIVNCYHSEIIKELAPAHGLMWNWIHHNPSDMLIARNVILAAETMGIKVFPNTATCWHFDDKIGQKYLLESVSAPLVPSHLFYDYGEALSWIDKADFPKVFKLRRGAASRNVRLVQTRTEARRLARTAFGRGFRPTAGILADLPTKVRSVRRPKDVIEKLKRLPQSILNIRRNNRLLGREKGYVYFQDFLPNNDFDTRVTVIGGRAFAFTRNVRPGDFRASGSGRINYDPITIDLSCVSVAMEVASRIESQSTAFDFAFDTAGNPRILEISYCYDAKAVYNCPGYWNHDLDWHQGHLWPQDAILEDFLRQLSF